MCSRSTGANCRRLNAIEIYVARLRRKLEGSGVGVRTLRGLGYQLVRLD